MSNGNFFAIGADEFNQACKIGIQPAVALLVMARGSGRDNCTTSWSALAIFNHSGMARRRAQAAIEAIIEAGLADVLQKGLKPRYKLKKPDDDKNLLWLPNELIDGAGKEIPPITKLRETGNLDLLQKFIELYGIQDLDSDGGIPRSVVRIEYVRNMICPTGHFIVYGFSDEKTTATNTGLFKGYEKKKDEKGNLGPWTVLSPLISMGLIERVTYMAESSDYDAELIYPVNVSTETAMMDLAYWFNESDAKGYYREIEGADSFGIAPNHITRATMVGVYRLKYRPKTGKTSRWWAMESEMTQAICAIVESLCGRKTTKPKPIAANQFF